MKKTILVVIMAILIATSCFAQEVEPDGIFSLHGTVWQAEQVLWLLPPQGIVPSDYEVGFYGGESITI